MNDQTYPTTHRPATIEDLDSWERNNETIASPPAMTTPGIAAWWGNTLAAAATTPGLAIAKDGSIVRPITTEEMQEALERKQDSYDRGRAAYIEWIESGVEPEYSSWLASEYAKTEGLPMPGDEENHDD